MDPIRLIDAQTLADHLNTTVGQVYRLSASGRIPRVRLGHRTVRYSLAAVLAALAQVPVTVAPRRAPAPHPPPLAPPIRDLPAYDWSSPTSTGGTMPPADRRG